MVRCEECSSEFFPGTIFCQDCGASLIELPHNSQENGLPSSSRIHFLIANNGRQGEIDCQKAVWIGRSDPDQGYWPQLDLTNDGAVELGVSRRHALIQMSENGLVIIDKNSKNGTWIEQEQLVPEKSYLLPQNARIRFGRLLLRTFLE